MRMCMHYRMTKVISLSEKAYGTLKQLKLGDESFSDVVLRLARSRGLLSEVIGLHPDLAGKTGLKRAAAAIREDLEKRLG
jgi:predicted CopG family antitoxin